ncbi:hydroxymethylpyrimidine/phosphomethylpyrimidine kinase [Aurantimonas sp. C2-6-R+9]|uniref:bifunctional hydroxymethylpyrimidine kinase/phosphomethylpyrimidine kinase n=1 Tax=unclassified Aurantimonas TaxID=2638230 RepID=UPI002E16B7FD|nr:MULTISPECIES: hydroxymethylpyrimidine/phosphomethylpyrimidine kinase [unclassified Aurantimonas]MEC5380295.1 hydroxymethylpyrimidine/phosphomethylpyrimidine kinase [Aurantimonas sp. C2-6-R+9]MEC5411247.1 hydroxymethylpyrimidine/phosphomethylpyrimidine kinase [Aurantimonas sp. C2-4-R8]
MSASPVVLAIAGSDSSGGAGIAADIRAAHDLGATLRFALSAVTAQSDRQVTAIHPVPLDILREQIRLALEDGAVGAIKIGMLGSAATVEAVASALTEYTDLPVVIDPVVSSSSGRRLLDDAAMAVFIERILPLATLLTPNLPELQILAAAILDAEPPATIAEQAGVLLGAGTKAVLVKGGHDQGDGAVDLLFQSGGDTPDRFASPRRPVAIRGTGCMLSTAICVALAQGDSLAASCRRGKNQIRACFERMVDDADSRIGKEAIPAVVRSDTLNNADTAVGK